MVAEHHDTNTHTARRYCTFLRDKRRSIRRHQQQIRKTGYQPRKLIFSCKAIIVQGQQQKEEKVDVRCMFLLSRSPFVLGSPATSRPSQPAAARRIIANAPRRSTTRRTEHRKSLFFFFFPAAPGPDTPLRTGSTHTPAAQSAHARRACALDDDPSYFVLRLVDDHLSGGSLPTALALDLTGSPSAQLRWIRSCYFS